MTADEIKAKLAIDGLTVSTADNGGWHWLTVRREHNGHRYSHTVRVPETPSDADLAEAHSIIDVWWAYTIADQT